MTKIKIKPLSTILNNEEIEDIELGKNNEVEYIFLSGDVPGINKGMFNLFNHEIEVLIEEYEGKNDWYTVQTNQEPYSWKFHKSWITILEQEKFRYYIGQKWLLEEWDGTWTKHVLSYTTNIVEKTYLPVVLIGIDQGVPVANAKTIKVTHDHGLTLIQEEDFEKISGYKEHGWTLMPEDRKERQKYKKHIKNK